MNESDADVSIFVILFWLVCFGFSVALFVKVWIMTNDVRKLMLHFCSNRSKLDTSALPQVAKLVAMGEEAKAIEYLETQMQARLDSMLALAQVMTPEEWNHKWQGYVRAYGKVYNYLQVKIPEKYVRFDVRNYLASLQAML